MRCTRLAPEGRQIAIRPERGLAVLHFPSTAPHAGGFTDRKPFTHAISDEGAKPWELVREHQYAFWKQQLNGEKVTLLGASLGGERACGCGAEACKEKYHQQRVAPPVL